MWISGDPGFVLLVHRRDDGLIAELYYSVRRADGDWECPYHLSGGIVGTELGTSAMAADALAGASTSVVAASESLVHTGRGPDGDEGELVHAWELPVSGDADLIEIESQVKSTFVVLVNSWTAHLGKRGVRVCVQERGT
ncbi:hypothetical protein [Streptomyces sp. ALI-76-A]|uniref:hypothetical protein n=1 Tax=Streptomyces sp. ALI-76-A TaxID=3025736 RepID=UPI00256EFC27|nr:hypothetical protein [Streptomyces sp. ALI-76-A]MDL5198884.1 hypothetical protein [Streptomyces sp. ALI-76-A]